MKSKNLMIGDWVKIDNGEKGKVVGLDYYNNGKNEIVIRNTDNLIRYSGEEYVKPIPLTPEILEKNGWDVEDACYAKCNLPDTYSSLEFYFHESRLRKWWEDVDEWDNHNKVRDITFQCHCSYVHELQHALRLCGLNDLADNFIIYDYETYRRRLHRADAPTQ